MTDKEQWIATRMLSSEESAAVQAEVNLGSPEQVAAAEWRCAYRVVGPSGNEVCYAYGLDAFQSLVMALTGIRAAVAGLGLKLSWEGGSPGDHGLPGFVPQYYGPEFSQRIEELITLEVNRLAEKVSRPAPSS